MGPKLATYWTHSEDSDQIERFSGSTGHFIGFVMRQLIYVQQWYMLDHFTSQVGDGDFCQCKRPVPHLIHTSIPHSHYVQMSIFRKFVHIFTYCFYVHTLFTHQHYIAASQAIRRFGMGIYHCQSKIANKANAASQAIWEKKYAHLKLKVSWLIVLVFYGPSTHFRSYRVRSVNLPTLTVPGQAS